jgi:hypothetical protein
MLLELISESLLYLVHLVGSNLLISLLCVLVMNDDTYFWTNKFLEMVIVLVEIRKKISQKC